MTAFEVNFDGLIGPTHHYGGLSRGNLASQQHRQEVSHPREAALQGLAKMKLLADLGIQQAVLPPHPRPHFGFLRQNGFTGSEQHIVAQAAKQRPELLSIAYSASAMWTANAATVSPSSDSRDGKFQLTPANLISTPHRALEAEFTTKVFRWLFRDEQFFTVHDPLPNEPELADEGAANHLRVCLSHGEPGVEIFVYGRDFSAAGVLYPKRHPARQTLAASRRIQQQHGVLNGFTVQQSPAAIDAGVFHNDVIAVANEDVLLCHAGAYVDQPAFLDRLRESYQGNLTIFEVSERELTLEEAVRTYLFNSQLLTLPKKPLIPESRGEGEMQPAPGSLSKSMANRTSCSEKSMLLLAPIECETHPRARAVIDRIVAETGRIGRVRFVDVRQSMKNGGGPACLRLRVAMTEREFSKLPAEIILTEALFQRLRDWVLRHYREQLTLADLGDPQLIDEVRAAMDELSHLLAIPALKCP